MGGRVKPKRSARLAAMRDGGGREAGGGRAEGVAPSLRRLARPSERNGTMVSGRGEDHKKEERLWSAHKDAGDKTCERRRAAQG